MLFVGGSVLAMLAPPGVLAAESPTPPAATLDEIVVTATRREEALGRVPISVAAYGQLELERRGVRSIDDIARITPGVDFQRSSFGGNTGVNIAIRGVRSSVGSATTALYIDDTPIQTRAVGLAAPAFPQVFDLERVEVLRGPQGTLFGAGAEGGAVRFITPAPDFRTSVYARAETATTRSGDMSHEAGLAVGGQIVDGRLAGRVSGWFRRDGGWVDHVDFFTGKVTDTGANRSDEGVIHAALLWTPTPQIAVTPSIALQDQRVHDGGAYWIDLSAPREGRFRNANLLESPAHDAFALPALKVVFDLTGVTLTSNSSIFSRRLRSLPDFTEFGGATTIGDPYPFSRQSAAAGHVDDLQQVLTQELRLASTPSDGRLSWVAGVFYSRSKQKDREDLEAGDLEQLLEQFYGLTIEQAYGEPLAKGTYAFLEDSTSKEEQFAAFGQADYRLTDRVKLTLGLRISRDSFHFSTFSGGPYNAPDHIATGSQSETPTTPKVGLSFQADADNLFYATIAKGYRAGGAQPQVPANVCRKDLANLDLTQSPAAYGSDHVWSYEAGSKNRLAGGRLQLDASVYYIDWSAIQQTVALPGCHLNFVANLGAALSRGVDIAGEARLTDNLTLGMAVGYVDAEYRSILRSGSALIVAEGDRIGGSPWTLAASLSYRSPTATGARYARLDYDVKSKTPRQDPQVSSFDPAIPQRPSVELVNLRAGVILHRLDLSVFANNLLDRHPADLTHDALGSPLFYATTLRPRTIGVTALYRY